jgi:FkbM family methyltransferase
VLGRMRNLKNKVGSTLETLLSLNIADHERHKENNVMLHEVVVKSRELIAMVNSDLQTSLDVKHTTAQLKTITRQSEEFLSELTQRSFVNREATLAILENQNTTLLAMHEVVGLKQSLQNIQQELIRLRHSQSLSSLAEIVSTLSSDLKILERDVKAVSSNQPAIVFSDNVSSSKPADLNLMLYLIKLIDLKIVLDIGAHHGEFSKAFLEAGATVYAFEPFPPSFEILHNLCSSNEQFYDFQTALGKFAGQSKLFVASSTDARLQQVASAFNSFEKRDLPGDIIFSSEQTVDVQTLDSLIDSQRVPARVGLLKIDTEGFDLNVLQGATQIQSDFVVCEYWDDRLCLSSLTTPKLDDLVREMTARGYLHYLVLATVDGTEDVFFYADAPETLEKAWGNAFFFKDEALFEKAFIWAERHLRRAYVVRSRIVEPRMLYGLELEINKRL